MKQTYNAVHYDTFSTSTEGSINAIDESEIVFSKGGEANLFSSGFNLANSAIGAGVLAFPFAYYQTGLILGLLLTFLQVFICSFTLEWLGKASLRSHPMNAESYEKIVNDKLGKVSAIIVTLCLVGNVFGAMVGFMIIIGDMAVPIVTQLFGESIFTGRGFVTLLFLIFIILPISCLQNIDSLKFTSVASLICITFVVCVVVGSSITAMFQQELPNSGFKLFNFSWDIFQAVPVITFALTCHAQLPPIYHELSNHTTERFRVVIGLTYTICSFLYISNGFFGYILFQDTTKDNILNNFANDDWLANIARLCVTFTITFSYPLMNYAFRTAFDFIVFDMGFKAIFGEKPNLPPEINISLPTHRRYILETIIAGILCWILNVLVPSISVIFGLIGALAGSFIVFIFPALLQYNESQSVGNKLSCFIVLIIGGFIAIVGTSVIILDFF